MLERQDIDALLVGALYGELSSAEQAQLTAHLESHPADRNALDDLKSVRERFTTSRIFEVQLDPPQAVSALLLQEAARRAPKLVVATEKKESWFDRFVRSFIAHPAIAAAASLVLVIGVAGTIYLQGGGDSQPRVGQQLEDTTVASAPGAASSGSAMIGQGNAHGAAQGADQGVAPSAVPAIVATTPPAKDSVAAGDKAGAINKNDGVVADLADPQQELSRVRAQRALGFADDGKREVAVSKHASTPQATKPAAPKGHYVEIPNASPQPKELDEEQDRSGKDVVASQDYKKAAPRGAGAAGGGAATGATATATTEAGPSAPPIAANTPAPTVAQAQRPAAPPPPPGEPPASKTVAKPDSNLAWAKDQHAKIIALVKDGKCSAAVPLASTLKTRAPDYYATNVATDRSLKSCMQYVNDTSTERAAEKKASKATDAK